MAVRTIVDNGNSNNRIDIIILGDGYTSSELSTTFTNHANALKDYLFTGAAMTQPFGRYMDYFNIHLVDVASNETGADIGPQGVFRDTALNSKYYWDGVTERLLYVDDFVTTNVMNNALSGTGIDAEMKFVTVNSDKYGGGGGTYGVYAGGNKDSLEVAVHEIAHSFAKLADEYGGNPGTYTGTEPSGINVSKDSSGQKWSHWLGYEEAGIGTIGAFEGGNYFDQGVYRPSFNSKMRSLNQPFDAISREAFILEFYKYVKPIDDYSFSTSSGALKDITGLSVDTIDTDTILVDWYVNGQKIVSGKDNVSVSDLGLTSGTYNVSAKAYDNTEWVRLDRSSLEQTVSWTVVMSDIADKNLVGTAVGENLPGGAGNDTITGAGGNDTIDGGAGTDTAIYAGDAKHFSITINKSGAVNVQDRTATEGTDSLTSIEKIDFQTGAKDVNLDVLDGVVNVSSADLSAFIEMYIAYFNRAPDAEGLFYWGTRLSEGMSKNQIAESFYVQPETKALYTNPDDTSGFVKAVYQNFLGRTPDTEGFDYWVKQLDDGVVSKPIFLLAIINGAKAATGSQTDVDYFTNKANIGAYYSVIKGLSNVDNGKAAMALYDGTAGSITAAKNAIDGYYNAALDANNGELLINLVGVMDDPFAV